MLPREVVERILVLLNLKLVLACRLVNREFNELIQSSTLLQYFLACEAAGVIDNPQSSLSYPERFHALKKWEDAWKNIMPMFETTIRVNHQHMSVHSLTGGAYFLDDDNLKDLHYCPLPSSPQDNPQWIRIPGHPGEGWSGTFINFALSEYEDDLIINVISSNIGNHPEMQLPEYSIDLILLKFSTGEYYPLVRHPRIHVQRSCSLRPDVIPRIVGNNIALVVQDEGDILFIFDWKTGHKRLQHETPGPAYRDLVFISPELLLVPNLILSDFEVWHLPAHPNPDPPVQVLSLKIPAISPNYSLFDIGCNGMSNPFRNSKPYFPPRPFFSSPENSIIAINLRLTSFPERTNASYTLIVRRCALLDTVKKWMSPPLFKRQLGLPIWLTNEVTVHKRADPDDGLVRLDIQSKLVSTVPHPRSSPRTPRSSTTATTATTPTSHITADSSVMSSTTSSASKYNFCQIQWADWGSPISRLLKVSPIQTESIVTSAGQRYAFAIPTSNAWGKFRIGVADFNPYNFRRNMEVLREDEDDGDNCNNEAGKTKEEKWEKLAHEGVFAEDVYMGLNCVIYHAPDEHKCELLLMDEERLVGLNADHSGRNDSIKVLYIG